MNQKHLNFIKGLDMRGQLSEDDSVALGNAIATFQYGIISLLYEKYKGTKGIETTKHEAVKLYKQLSKVLKFETLKETYLEDIGHTCACCEERFPSKKQFKKDNKGYVYPLFVKCTFPLVKYLEKKGYTDIKEILKDEKVFDKKNYVALCMGCKPLAFRKKS